MSEIENPRIRPVGDLLNENFFVPRYQRGYRWGKQEITELLDDVLQYYKLTQDRENKVSKFYCLQPIVVKSKTWKNSDNESLKGWELIDGQQRLTTLLIILSYLEDIRQILNGDTKVYTIYFETREDCKDFFSRKAFKIKVDDSNVDFFHISKGYEFIKEWFEKENNKVEVLNTFLKTEYNVSIIWYESKDESQAIDEENSIDLFTRLNEGKIPLTDAELIKALLLQSDLYPNKEDKYVEQRLFEIASEWDQIEAGLQDETMWLFINDITEQPSSKIEFIFNLLAEKWNKENAQILIQYNDKEGKPKHFEYLVFDKFLAQKRKEKKANSLDPINDIWKEVKSLYSIFREWYEDHTLFHYIGYLLAIYNNENKKEKFIKEAISLKLTKSDFINYLKKKIANEIYIKRKRDNSQEFKLLNEIAYGEDNNEIIKILLLFNVETLVQNKKENARFPFHLYKKEKITSIEHIHPQNPNDIDVDQERSNIWLESHKLSLETLLIDKKYLDHKDKIEKKLEGVYNLLRTYNKDKFKIEFINILELYSEISNFNEDELKHTLSNLALVDKDTNSSLNNSFFDIKRELLKENKLGRYIPICTQRAFSKYYSKSPKEMIFWSSDDRKSYYAAIESTYNFFVKLKEDTNGDE
ncbi:MAG: DUF262 domain-containing protein [Leptospiraceae bacterium]|nr:DUF262 domain-containing protein [Leptospiraceae bacterium]MBL0264424.1 DUF262 domain-containing protein [Leptospiraceae bacterium]